MHPSYPEMHPSQRTCPKAGCYYGIILALYTDGHALFTYIMEPLNNRFKIVKSEVSIFVRNSGMDSEIKSDKECR